MSSFIEIAIADDELLFRKGLREILKGKSKIKVLFEAFDGIDLLNKLRAEFKLPHILLIDIDMPNLNGVESTKIIKQEFPSIYVIALTSYFSKSFVLNMINVGAVGYLEKNCSIELLLETIVGVSKNGFYYDSRVMKFLHDGLIRASNTNAKTEFDNTFLTKREKEILLLIVKQYSTKEIAETLFLSPRTIEGHKKKLFEKTNSKNTTALVLFAIKKKIIELDEISRTFN